MTIAARTHVGGMTSAPGADECEVVFERTFAAPRALVFRAWTDPELLARWWGPAGFSTAGCTVDARPGGSFSLVMLAPNGLELPVAGAFEAVVEPERLVYRIAADVLPDRLRPLLRNYGEQPLPVMHVTVTFIELAPRSTRLSIRTRLASVEDVTQVAARGAADGWAESLERLAALLDAR